MPRDRHMFITELIPLVKEEAANIKLHATDEEKSKLDKEKVDGHSKEQCIYGLMTGSCNSPRAAELISLCCQKVYVKDEETNYLERLNGHPSEVLIGPYEPRHTKYLSPTENMIFEDAGGKRAAIRIIDYIKGETNELTFD